MSLKEYRDKRDFRTTPEPRGKALKSSSGRRFVVQKHAARRLHYDLRLEDEGVLKSWAVPKGPSYDPAEKRLAVQVEDHPLEYGNFEGEIEENQYGAGTVMVWDKGTWTPIGDWKEGWKEGKLNFTLKGKKLKGAGALVQFKGKKKPDSRNWLLIKPSDKEAKRSHQFDITVKEPDSVKTGRSLKEIEAQNKAGPKEEPASGKKGRPLRSRLPGAKKAEVAGRSKKSN